MVNGAISTAGGAQFVSHNRPDQIKYSTWLHLLEYRLGFIEQTTSNPTGLDAYSPAQMAERVEDAGVGKADLSALSTLMLAILAGAFIAFGAMFYTFIVAAGPDLGFVPSRLLGGMAFSLGLILVIVGVT